MLCERDACATQGEMLWLDLWVAALLHVSIAFEHDRNDSPMQSPADCLQSWCLPLPPKQGRDSLEHTRIVATFAPDSPHHILATCNRRPAPFVLARARTTCGGGLRCALSPTECRDWVRLRGNCCAIPPMATNRAHIRRVVPTGQQPVCRSLCRRVVGAPALPGRGRVCSWLHLRSPTPGEVWVTSCLFYFVNIP